MGTVGNYSGGDGRRIGTMRACRRANSSGRSSHDESGPRAPCRTVGLNVGLFAHSKGTATDPADDIPISGAERRAQRARVTKRPSI